MTAPTIFGHSMRPAPTIEGWTLKFGIFQVDVTELLAHVGRAFGGRIRFGQSVILGDAVSRLTEWPHRNPQAAAAECEAWLMRTMLETAGAMGFELRRVES
jgi:hypothetical protein